MYKSYYCNKLPSVVCKLFMSDTKPVDTNTTIGKTMFIINTVDAMKATSTDEFYYCVLKLLYRYK